MDSDEDEIPEPLQHLNPHYVYLKYNAKKEYPYIILEYGGALIGHWGVIILPEGCTPEKSRPRQKKIGDGIYIYSAK